MANLNHRGSTKGLLKVSHLKPRPRTNWGSRFCRSFAIVIGCKGLDVEDFTSLLDQILLVDTLLLGFAINMMTASTLGKSDYTSRDSWALSMLVEFEAHGVDPHSYPGIMSYKVVRAGSLSISLLFMSLAIALFLYVVLNLSECRESKHIFEIWARYFIFPIWLSIACLFGGLTYFYLCYNFLVEIIFPLYCTMDFSPLYADLAALPESKRIFGINESRDDYQTMIEIAAGDFNECKESSFTFRMFEESFRWTLLLMVACFFLFGIFNLIVHMFSINEDKPIPLDESIDHLLSNLFDERHYVQYREAFQEQFITEGLMTQLSYQQLREMGLPVGHAMRLLNGIQDAASAAEASTIERLPNEETDRIAAHLTPIRPDGPRAAYSATLLTAGTDHVFGRTNIEGIDADKPPPGISKVHMTFYCVGDGFELADEGSRNGTFVNKQRVHRRCLLNEGDHITVGRDDANLGYVYHIGPPKAGMSTKYPARIDLAKTSQKTKPSRETESVRTVTTTVTVEKNGNTHSSV